MIKDIKKAVVSKLKEIYPDYPVYGNDTVDGYSKPCFFVEVSQLFSEGGVNYKYRSCVIEITLVQCIPDEVESLDFFVEIEKAFYPKLEVGDRLLNTSNFAIDWLGENRNIPKVDFDVDYFEATEKEEKQELLTKLRIKEVLN